MQLVRRHCEDAAGLLELRRLRFGQLRGEPVVRVRVVVELLATADAAQCGVVASPLRWPTYLATSGDAGLIF